MIKIIIASLFLASSSYASYLVPHVKGGLLTYGTATGFINPGSDGQVLTADSTQTLGIKWAAGTATAITAPPTVQRFTSGSGTYNKDYTFVITSGSATVGATYTNNAVTFTVYATVASATQVVMSGNGAPTATGTLTKASGTGDATLTFSQVLAPLYLRVVIAGAGGGGSGGSATGGAGGAGSANTTFGSSLLTANFGSGGIAAGASGGAGGSFTVSAPAVNVYSIAGTRGGDISGSSTNQAGAPGGLTPLGGGGMISGGTGIAGGTNSGSGGGGGAGPGTGSGGSGGGAGGYIHAIITAPSATYAYAMGTGGAGGTAGTGSAGGAGAAGYVEVTEFYQ